MAKLSVLASKARELRGYFEDARVELEKITWPTRKETVVVSSVVVVLVLALSFFLGIVDMVLTKVVAFILS